ncbi:MAG: alpha/beta hydrolase [Armatimonadetes bacterium]|nr:alpha/beta hydrolase [Armatimonadota bacterium]
MFASGRPTRKSAAELFGFMLAVSVIVLACASCTEDGDGAFPGMVDIGGHSLFLSCVGEGEPTVILESGIEDGGSFGGWGPIQDSVKAFARVCFYDRAGLGRSASGPEPRDSRRIATELHTLLHTAGLQPPYILVGHSMGGLHIRVFADEYPTEVAGMVFIDPTPKELMTEPLTQEQLDNLVAAGAPEGVLAEAGPGITNSIPQWQTLGPLPDVPVVVLTSSPPSETTQGDIDVDRWQTLSDLHQALADEVSDGIHIVATQAGHYIHIDEPDLVVDAIRRVLSRR